MKDLIGKKIKTKSGTIYLVIDTYVTDTAGLCLVVVSDDNGKAMLDTIRVFGSVLEIIP